MSNQTGARLKMGEPAPTRHGLTRDTIAGTVGASHSAGSHSGYLAASSAQPAPRQTTTVERFGPVTIRRRGSRWRVTWFEGGRQVERGAPSHDQAQQVAMQEAGRLLQGDTTAHKDLRYELLVAATLQSGRTDEWGDGHRIHMTGIARNHIIPLLGPVPCAEMTDEKVRVLLLSMAETGYSKSTINHVLKLLRLVSREGIKRGVWRPGMEPTAGVGIPSLAKGRDVGLHEILATDIPTDQQVDALATELDKRDWRYGLIVRLAATSGARWSELMALRAEDIDIPNRVIHIRWQVTNRTGKWLRTPPKTAAGVRDTILASVIANDVQRLCNERPDGLLFATRTGTPMSRSNWSEPFRTAARAAGYPDAFSMHTLRHYAISRWRRLGLPDTDCTKMAGHANVSVTLRLYAGADSKALDRAKALI